MAAVGAARDTIAGRQIPGMAAAVEDIARDTTAGRIHERMRATTTLALHLHRTMVMEEEDPRRHRIMADHLSIDRHQPPPRHEMPTTVMPCGRYSKL